MTDEKPPTPADDTEATPADSHPVAAATGQPEPVEPVDSVESTEPAESTKSAFEAAIARKKAAGQARSAHLDGGAKVGGATASHKTSRTFRRKSG